MENSYFQSSQTPHWPHYDGGSSISPTDLSAMTPNPFELTMNQFFTLDGFAMSNSTPFIPNEQSLGQLAMEMTSLHGHNHDAAWAAAAADLARSSFSSTSTEASVMSDHQYIGMLPPGTEQNPPKKRRKRHVDPEVRRTEKLAKNRRAAERCREKQRAYVGALQDRARTEEIRRVTLIAQVNQLRNEILSLKEHMVTHSGCNDERIKQYLLAEVNGSMERRRRRSSFATASPPGAITPGGVSFSTSGLCA